MSSPAKLTWLPAIAVGFLTAGAVAGQGGLFEAIRFSRGGYQVFLAEAVRLIAAYALIGIVLATTGLALVWALRRLGRSRLAGVVGPPFALALLPAWGCVLLAAVFINKRLLPQFFSLESLIGNTLLAVAALALAWFLARFERLHTAALGLVACLAVADVAALFVLLTPADAARSSKEQRAEAVDTESARPTLVLVVIDTLRADHLGVYGYRAPTSPFIDVLADKSVVFERAYSPSNWTRPAVASLITSTGASTHGVTDFQYALPQSLELVTETLESAGYRTAIFSGNPNLEPEDGYRRGTDHFVSFSHRGILGRSFLSRDFLAADLPGLDTMIRRLLGEAKGLGYEPRRLTDRAFEWLDSNQGPRFAYLHYVGPHDPYLPPERLLERISDHELDESVARPPAGLVESRALSKEGRRRMIAQYDAEILWHDLEIGRLVKKLEQVATMQDVVLVVTSDHGEGFGENDVWGHGLGMFEELVRVPLIVWCSNACGESRRTQSLVSLLDVAPTLLELAGVDAPKSFEGDSLLAILESPRDYRDRVVISENPKSSELSIRTSDWTFAEVSSGSRDRAWLWPAESSEPRAVDTLVGPQALERVASLRALLAQRQGEPSSRREIELDHERIEELRALGYLN